ncbi:hypothetical protein NDU88_011738 [Pleurodeles waltl]|uniref:Uncharacterized protein n=1 Tax=Pleurodeles waltl TaxID=8319 RepID=A0AAV7QY45_PLEWA|nr:hypothetical protein NDU88_011738 [Pleurodeles waltl]
MSISRAPACYTSTAGHLSEDKYTAEPQPPACALVDCNLVNLCSQTDYRSFIVRCVICFGQLIAASRTGADIVFLVAHWRRPQLAPPSQARIEKARRSFERVNPPVSFLSIEFLLSPIDPGWRRTQCPFRKRQPVRSAAELQTHSSAKADTGSVILSPP